MKNKVEIKLFLGMEVRIVNDTHIVLKDMFKALGRVRADGTWTDEKKKMIKFLSEIGKSHHHESLVVVVKRGQTEEVQCLKLETVSIVLTQFKPTARAGQEALETWIRFMKFVDDILTSLEVYKYIIVDKEKQKKHVERVTDIGGTSVQTNNQVNTIMAKLIGVYSTGIKMIKKDELKKYQPNTTIDLLEAREFVLDKFANAYEFTKSHKLAGEMALRLSLEKYDLTMDDI